jgi:hypothetical protein
VRFLLPRTQLRRVPLFRHVLPCGRPCGTRIARPSSVPSSGFLPLSTVPASSRLARGLLDPAVRRGPRRFAVLFHTARVPGAPLQSFPFPGSRTRSRGPLLPCGFVFRLPPAQRLRELHGRFHLDSRRLFATRAHPKVDPGLMSQDEGSLRSLGRSPRHTEVCRTYRPLPTDTGLAGKRPARPLRSFAPPGSPFSDDPNTWPGWERPSVLSWGSFALQSLLHHGSGFGLSRRHTRGAEPHPRAPPGAQPSRLHAATRTPTPELASPGSVDTRCL